MKILFSIYQAMINELSQLVFHLGFRSDLSMYLCQYLKIKGKPIYPSRAVISRKEMTRLFNFTRQCYDDIGLLAKVLGL